MKVVGKKFVSYIRKSDNTKIEGYELHFTFFSKNVEGVATDKIFISMNVVESSGGSVPCIGDEIDLLYNKFGKVTGYIFR